MEGVDMKESLSYEKFYINATKSREERFKAEYDQFKSHYEALKIIVYTEMQSYDSLNFTPICPLELYMRQLDAMKQYLDILEERAKLEKIEL